MSETQTRAPRAEETQQRRRRRETMGADRNLKLHVPDEAKDPNFVYRWIKSAVGRVQQLTKMDDYDLVTESDLPSKSVGTLVERASNKSDGESVVLVRKPRKFYEEDKAKEAARIDATEETMRRAPPASSEGLTGSDGVYVPGGKNTVGGR